MGMAPKARSMPKVSEWKCRGSPPIHPAIETMESPGELERLKERRTSDPISGRRGATLKAAESRALVVGGNDSDRACARSEVPSRAQAISVSRVVELIGVRIMA